MPRAQCTPKGSAQRAEKLVLFQFVIRIARKRSKNFVNRCGIFWVSGLPSIKSRRYAKCIGATASIRLLTSIPLP